MDKLDKNIVLIGMPGCGKSSIGSAVAKVFKAKFIDTDEYIEKERGMSIPEIFEHGEEYFRKLESEAAYKVSKEKSVVISTGGGIIKNPENINLLKENGIIIFIDRPVENIIKDIKTSNRPLLKQDVNRIYEILNERYETYKRYCDYRIVNDGTIAKVVDEIIKYIEK